MASADEKRPLFIIDDEPRGSARISDLMKAENIVHIFNDERLASKREIAAELEDKLEGLKRQVDELHKAVLGGKELSQEVKRLEGLAATIEKAGEIGRNLTADVVLPPAKDLRVKLVPSDTLDRLEEYRADEAKAYLLVGAFLGAVLGILSNWVTQEAFTVTKISGAFMTFFGSMAILAAAWALQISRRARSLRTRLLGIPEGEAGTKHDDGKEHGKA